MGPPTPAVQPDAPTTLEEFIERLLAVAGLPPRRAIDILEILDSGPDLWTAFYRWLLERFADAGNL